MLTVYYENDRREKEKFFRSYIRGKNLVVAAKCEDIPKLAGCGNIILPEQSNLSVSGMDVYKPDILALCRDGQTFARGLLPGCLYGSDREVYWYQSQTACLRDIYDILCTWYFNDSIYDLPMLREALAKMLSSEKDERGKALHRVGAEDKFKRNLNSYLVSNAVTTAMCIVSGVYAALDALEEITYSIRKQPGDFIPEGNIFIPLDLFNAPPFLLSLILDRETVIYGKGDFCSCVLDEKLPACISLSSGMIEADKYIFSKDSCTPAFQNLLDEGNTRSLFALRAESPRLLDKGEVLVFEQAAWRQEDVPEIISSPVSFESVSDLEFRARKYRFRNKGRAAPKTEPSDREEQYERRREEMSDGSEKPLFASAYDEVDFGFAPQPEEDQEDEQP